MDVLKVENIKHAYGGLSVLQGVSFSLRSGEKVALIGPNGSGKTTLINVLNGLIAPVGGRVYLLGRDVTALPAHQRVRLGMARSFQIMRLFPHLTLMTNVLLAIQGIRATRYKMIRPLTRYHDDLARARDLLEGIGLWANRDELVSTLGYGQQRQVEVILALASKPKLLLLDEPGAGLTRAESEQLIVLMENLAQDATVLLSDHDMELVFRLTERVIVLNYGQVIADGRPQEVQSDQKVRQIYLGTKRR